MCQKRYENYDCKLGSFILDMNIGWSKVINGLIVLYGFWLNQSNKKTSCYIHYAMSNTPEKPAGLLLETCKFCLFKFGVFVVMSC